ncbi:hypothetical protein [Spirosoma validum]|uniref:Uncharacterized protein n=1 Tax=Spirosoma validum TaxID=2771355 RepID=A0A927GGN2_9BACT|nr:hypothetical protein [Spirosoma validum]MBD2756790.1 hypothetical protein [Spirosoma validum]
MRIIGNFSLSAPLARHLQFRLNQVPNTVVQIRDIPAENLAQERVVIKTDMAGWQQFSQLMSEYGIA